MVVVDEDERTVTEGLGSEGINDRYNASIVDMFPLFDTSNCSCVAKTVACSMSVSAFKEFEIAYLRDGAVHSSCHPPSEPCKPSWGIQRQRRSCYCLYPVGPSCDTFPSQDEGVQNLRSLDTRELGIALELTWHDLTGGLRLLLEFLSKAIWNEEVMDGSLVWG